MAYGGRYAGVEGAVSGDLRFEDGNLEQPRIETFLFWGVSLCSVDWSGVEFLLPRTSKEALQAAHGAAKSQRLVRSVPPTCRSPRAIDLHPLCSLVHRLLLDHSEMTSMHLASVAGRSGGVEIDRNASRSFRERSGPFVLHFT